MVCPSCESPVSPGMQFCVQCGEPVADRVASDALAGQSLREIIRRDAPVGWRHALEIVRAICAAVAEANAQGIVGLELRPEVLFVEHVHRSAVRVSLFETAIEVMRFDGPNDTDVMRAVPPWMAMPPLDYYAPEKMMGKPADARTEVYVLGLLAYELMTGTLPFAAAKGPAGLLGAQHEVPRAPSAVQPAAAIPFAVDALVIRCLALAPGDRFADAAELVREMTALTAVTVAGR